MFRHRFVVSAIVVGGGRLAVTSSSLSVPALHPARGDSLKKSWGQRIRPAPSRRSTSTQTATKHDGYKVPLSGSASSLASGRPSSARDASAPTIEADEKLTIAAEEELTGVSTPTPSLAIDRSAITLDEEIRRVRDLPVQNEKTSVGADEELCRLMVDHGYVPVRNNTVFTNFPAGKIPSTVRFPPMEFDFLLEENLREILNARNETLWEKGLPPFEYVLLMEQHRVGNGPIADRVYKSKQEHVQ